MYLLFELVKSYKDDMYSGSRPFFIKFGNIRVIYLNKLLIE